MPITCTTKGRIIHVSWSGTIAKDDLETLGKELPRIGRALGFAPDVLHTFEGATGLDFEPAAAYQYARQQKPVAIPETVRAAMVVTTKEAEYLSTVFKTLNRRPNLEMKVFFDEASARRWLARE